MTIYRLGDALRWSQQVLAEKADADVTTVQHWESGGVAPCGVDLYNLSLAFSVATDAIYAEVPKSVAEVRRLHPGRCDHDGDFQFLGELECRGHAGYAFCQRSAHARGHRAAAGEDEWS